MKKIQDYRFAVQILFLILTSTSFIINFRITLIIILILTLLSGVFYCGWICPFGFVQDVFSHIGTAFGIKKRKMLRSVHKILKYSRYILLGFVILSGFDLIFSILTFDPRINFTSIISGTLISTTGSVVIILFVLVSIFFERPFCNYFCVQGAKYGILSILRPITIKRNEKICIGCKKCDLICPMNIKVSNIKNLRDPQCINCFQCISSCPVEKVLSYGKIKINKEERKRYIIILITIIILAFGLLGYNNLIKNKLSNETNLLSAKESVAVTNIYEGDPKVAKGISDGSYTGSSDGFKGKTVVKAIIKDEMITDIEIVSYDDDKIWFDRAKKSILVNIIENQDTDIDIVAGATHSSVGIKNSVIDALEGAK